MKARFYVKEEEGQDPADWVEITNPSGDSSADAVDRIKRERAAEWAEIGSQYEAWKAAAKKDKPKKDKPAKNEDEAEDEDEDEPTRPVVPKAAVKPAEKPADKPARKY